MSSNAGELRHVMLGSIFKPEVPLGAARGTPITCHTSATGKGKLHGSPECRSLRSAASVNQFDIPFGEAVERLCTNCRWALSTDSPILPLGAAVNDVDSLTIWLDRDPEDENDIKAERDAAIALSTGDYPPPPPMTSATRMRKTARLGTTRSGNAMTAPAISAMDASHTGADCTPT
ncbi:hypothetical protein ACFY1G_19880 [Streptomyces olivaceus]|uniref:hypothetical protein n=1 Tax=Streptomyces olivaceus TaxID=47716 RepID=UPI0036C770D6